MKLDYFDHIPAATLLINVASDSIMMNAYAKKLLGRTFYEIEQLEQYLIFGGTLSVAPQSEKETHGILLTKDTENKGLRLSFSPISDYEYFLVVNEESLNYSHILNDRFISEFLSNLPVGIIIRNLTKDTVEYVSNYIAKRVGITQSQLQKINWRSFTYHEDIASEEKTIRKYETTSTFSLKKRIQSKDGKIFWVEETVKTYFIDNNAFIIQFIRDITNEIENTTEVLRAKKLLEQSQSLNKAFIDNLPHEIRTPLNAIIGFSSLLNDDTLASTERDEYVRYIHKSGNEILNIVDNAIELSMIESNQVRLESQMCYLNKLFNDLHSKIEAEVQVGKKAIDVLVNQTEKDDFSLVIDQKQVLKIMHLLIENALKYTEEGSIEIGYKILSSKEFQLYVYDTGIGIEEDQLETIFKTFGKSGNLNTNKNRGGGLGLTIVQKLVELLKGKIQVESKMHEGSKFTITLPVSENKPYRTRLSKSDLNWSTKTILIAEDTELNFEYLKELLRKTKINILWAKDGQEAIDLYQEHKDRISLILMDILMPEVDGLNATKAIKKINADVPVIAQTALSMSEDRKLCLDAGCSQVLVKPIISEDLFCAISQYV